MRIDGRTTIGDSKEIIRWLRGKRGAPFLEEKNSELMNLFDTQLALNVRRWVYSELFAKKPQIVLDIWMQHVPAWQKALAPLLFPAAQFLLSIFLGLKKKDAAKVSLHKVEEVLRKVDNLLEDGRNYLCGNSLSMEDIAFASLCAPIVSGVSKYGGKNSIDRKIEEMPESLKRQFSLWDQRPFAKFVKRIYNEERVC